MATIYRCDRCGLEVLTTTVLHHLTSIRGYGSDRAASDFQRDLCSKCQEELVRFLTTPPPRRRRERR